MNLPEAVSVGRLNCPTARALTTARVLGKENLSLHHHIENGLVVDAHSQAIPLPHQSWVVVRCGCVDKLSQGVPNSTVGGVQRYGDAVAMVTQPLRVEQRSPPSPHLLTASFRAIAEHGRLRILRRKAEVDSA